jgi:hypothetical protein
MRNLSSLCRRLLQMDLTLNIVERKTGGLSAGGGISAQGHADGAMPGFIGSFSYSQRNLFGLNQKLAATVELGQVRRGCCLLCRRARCSLVSCGMFHLGVMSCVQRLTLHSLWISGGQPVQDIAHRPMGGWRCASHQPHDQLPGAVTLGFGL